MPDESLPDLLARIAADDILFDWEVIHNAETTVVRAYCRDLYDARFEAFQAAETLLADVLAGGYRLAHRAELKVVTQDPDFENWRGGIDVTLVRLPLSR
jgi:hypothetical protein